MCNDDEVASFSGPFSSSSSFSSQTLNMNKTLNIRIEKKEGPFCLLRNPQNSFREKIERDDFVYRHAVVFL